MHEKTVDESDIVNRIEYLLFVEHEEDMKGYTHLRPIIQELAHMSARVAEDAVAAFQREMTYRIAKRVQSVVSKDVADAIYDAKVEVGHIEAHHDW